MSYLENQLDTDTIAEAHTVNEFSGNPSSNGCTSSSKPLEVKYFEKGCSTVGNCAASHEDHKAKANQHFDPILLSKLDSSPKRKITAATTIIK
jgi:hypothetical protein